MKFYRLSGATFYDYINTMYEFIKSFLDDKLSVFEEYGAFNLLSNFASEAREINYFAKGGNVLPISTKLVKILP